MQNAANYIAAVSRAVRCSQSGCARCSAGTCCNTGSPCKRELGGCPTLLLDFCFVLGLQNKMCHTEMRSFFLAVFWSLLSYMYLKDLRLCWGGCLQSQFSGGFLQHGEWLAGIPWLEGIVLLELVQAEGIVAVTQQVLSGWVNLSRGYSCKRRQCTSALALLCVLFCPISL